MRFLLRPFHVLYVLYAFALFVILMIPVFAWSLLVLLLGKDKGAYLVYGACMVWADVWLALVGIHHRNIVKGAPIHGRAYIFVSNHISYLDSAIIPKTFRRPLRPLGKVEMARIPIFGFIYRHVIVTVDRSSAGNRAKSVHQMKSILRRGISVLVFPEGTFNTTHRPLKEFYDGAFRIAIETGTPIRPVLLLDTYARMNYRSIFSLNPGRSRALFLPEIGVEGLTQGDVAALRDKVFVAMEAELAQACAAWIDGTA